MKTPNIIQNLYKMANSIIPRMLEKIPHVQKKILQYYQIVVRFYKNVILRAIKTYDYHIMIKYLSHYNNFIVNGPYNEKNIFKK